MGPGNAILSLSITPLSAITCLAPIHHGTIDRATNTASPDIYPLSIYLLYLSTQCPGLRVDETMRRDPARQRDGVEHTPARVRLSGARHLQREVEHGSHAGRLDECGCDVVRHAVDQITEQAIEISSNRATDGAIE